MRPVATKQPLSANITQTSEKYKACFNIFHSECCTYSCFSTNITQTSESCASEWVKIYFYTQRAQLNFAEGINVKFTSIFFSVGAVNLRGLLKDTEYKWFVILKNTLENKK